MNRFLIPALVLASGMVLAGCVTAAADDPTVQQLEVHAILDHRELAGVGCLLENDAGRWFVVAPGRVTVTRSSKPLAVSCKRDGAGSVDERWGPHYDRNRLLGSILITAGFQQVVEHGYSYPGTLTVVMRAPAPGDAQAGEGTPVF